MANGPLDVATEIERSLKAMSREIQRGTKAALREAGQLAKAEHEKLATTVPGADRRFSRMKKHARLNVKVRVDRDGGARVSPQGSWKIAEEGADPHAQPGGRGQHSGTAATQGKQSWSKGKAEATKKVDQLMPQRIDAAARKGFTSG